VGKHPETGQKRKGDKKMSLCLSQPTDRPAPSQHFPRFPASKCQKNTYGLKSTSNQAGGSGAVYSLRGKKSWEGAGSQELKELINVGVEGCPGTFLTTAQGKKAGKTR